VRRRLAQGQSAGPRRGSLKQRRARLAGRRPQHLDLCSSASTAPQRTIDRLATIRPSRILRPRGEIPPRANSTLDSIESRATRKMLETAFRRRVHRATSP